jgi:probable F420-dependent oxidoreductase
LEFGVNIVNFGPGASAGGILRWAQIAEALGFHSIWLSDHIAMTTKVRQRYPEPFFDPFATLSWLAGQTTRVKLGTTVCVLPYRHPLLLARLVANLDQLSGGRFILGVGVGSSDDEYQAFGIPFRRRGRMADEGLEILKAIWTSDGPVSHRGREFEFDDVAPMRTHQSPRPPIWVGGRSEAAMQRAVLHGDGWHSSRSTIRDMAEVAIPLLHRLADELGRPVPRFVPRVKLDIRPEPVTGPGRLIGIGSVDQIHADLSTLEALGAEHVVFDWNPGEAAQTADNPHGWWELAELSERVINLERGALR